MLRESFCAVALDAVGPSDFVRSRRKKFANALPPPGGFKEADPLTDLERPFALRPDEGVGGSVDELDDKVENVVELEEELSGARAALPDCATVR